MNLGFGEIVLILIVVLLVFGAKKLPELGKAMGLGLKEFKKAVKEDDKQEEKPSKKAGKKRK